MRTCATWFQDGKVCAARASRTRHAPVSHAEESSHTRVPRSRAHTSSAWHARA